MDRESGKKHNEKVIALVKAEIHKPRIVYMSGQVFKFPRYSPPSYKHVCFYLSQLGSKSTRGNDWTPKRLFRMLQRTGYSGLYGVFHNEVQYQKKTVPQ